MDLPLRTPRREDSAGALPSASLLVETLIRLFGRFPDRNQALGRISTAEERKVTEPGETF